MSNPHFDSKMGMNMTKLIRPRRATFQFVKEGHKRILVATDLVGMGIDIERVNIVLKL